MTVDTPAGVAEATPPTVNEATVELVHVLMASQFLDEFMMGLIDSFQATFDSQDEALVFGPDGATILLALLDVVAVIGERQREAVQ